MSRKPTFTEFKKSKKSQMFYRISPSQILSVCMGLITVTDGPPTAPLIE